MDGFEKWGFTRLTLHSIETWFRSPALWVVTQLADTPSRPVAGRIASSVVRDVVQLGLLVQGSAASDFGQAAVIEYRSRLTRAGLVIDRRADDIAGLVELLVTDLRRFGQLVSYDRLAYLAVPGISLPLEVRIDYQFEAADGPVAVFLKTSAKAPGAPTRSGRREAGVQSLAAATVGATALFAHGILARTPRVIVREPVDGTAALEECGRILARMERVLALCETVHDTAMLTTPGGDDWIWDCDTARRRGDLYGF